MFLDLRLLEKKETRVLCYSISEKIQKADDYDVGLFVIDSKMVLKLYIKCSIYDISKFSLG